MANSHQPVDAVSPDDAGSALPAICRDVPPELSMRFRRMMPAQPRGRRAFRRWVVRALRCSLR